MSLNRVDRDPSVDNIDSIIRWALRDSVADAEPSPQVWERIRQRIRGRAGASVERAPARHKALLRRLWPSQLVRPGATLVVPMDSRLAWQRRVYAFDLRASSPIIYMFESRMILLSFL
jgi:hypothetical protein